MCIYAYTCVYMYMYIYIHEEGSFRVYFVPTFKGPGACLPFSFRFLFISFCLSQCSSISFDFLSCPFCSMNFLLFLFISFQFISFHFLPFSLVAVDFLRFPKSIYFLRCLFVSFHFFISLPANHSEIPTTCTFFDYSICQSTNIHTIYI